KGAFMRFTVTEDSLDQYEKFLNERSGAINDCIMFLDDACLGIRDSYKSQSPGDLAILMLVRNLIESIDGVCILISKGSVQPCEPLLRSALDAFLGVNYILKEDSNERGLAYLVADRHRLINFFRQCDPDDERGKQVRKEIPDEFLHGI